MPPSPIKWVSFISISIREDLQATSKVLNKARETGVDMWIAAMSETLSQNFDLEEEQIKHQLSQIIEKAGDPLHGKRESGCGG